LGALDIDLHQLRREALELGVERGDSHADALGFAADVADLGVATQPAPAVEIAKVAEVRFAGARAQRQSATLDAGECASELGGQRGDRLEREVPAARRNPHRVAEHLSAVRADIYVAAIGRERPGE